MRHVNKTELLGVICKDDPEIKTFDSGNRVCNFNLVTNKNKKDKQTGEWVTTPTYHRVVIWKDDFIQEIASGVRKGATVQVVGEISNREWTTQDGQKRYTTKIVVDNFGEFQFLEAPKPKGGTKPTKSASRAVSDDDSDVPF